ncbi:MAG: ATP-grasp domain-containing protein [Candidatus Limnocylindria bacterium]
MATRVAVIGGRIEMLEAAAEFGLDVVLVHTAGRYDPRCEELCEQIVHAELDEHGNYDVDCLRGMHTQRPFARVLTLTEPGLLPAARLNTELGLGGDPPDTVRLLKDKARMRLVLDATGLSPVRHRVVGSAAELSEFLVELGGGPAVIKPLDAGGSAGVRLVERVANVARSWREVEASGRARMLAEEYLCGPEVSVEAFTCNGRHTIVAVTDKYLGPGFVEIGHSMPAEMSDATWRQVAGLTTDLLDAVGLTEGPTHTEIKLTGRGPRIVESHNRLGGGFIPDLVKRIYGVDLTRYAVGVPLGLVSGIPAVPAASGGAAIRFILAEPGTVTDVDRPDATHPAVTVDLTAEPGTVVPPLTWSVDRVCGHVIATGRTAGEAVARCNEAVAQISVTTDPAAARAEIAS